MGGMNALRQAMRREILDCCCRHYSQKFLMMCKLPIFCYHSLKWKQPCFLNRMLQFLNRMLQREAVALAMCPGRLALVVRRGGRRNSQSNPLHNLCQQPSKRKPEPTSRNQSKVGMILVSLQWHHMCHFTWTEANPARVVAEACRASQKEVMKAQQYVQWLRLSAQPPLETKG